MDPPHELVTDIVGPWIRPLSRDIHPEVPMVTSMMNIVTRIINNRDDGLDVIHSHYRQWKTIIAQLLSAMYPTIPLEDIITHSIMIYFVALINQCSNPIHKFYYDISESLQMRISLIDYPRNPNIEYSPSEMQLTIIQGGSYYTYMDHYIVNSNVSSFTRLINQSEINTTINQSSLPRPINRIQYLCHRQRYDYLIYQIANQYYNEQIYQ